MKEVSGFSETWVDYPSPSLNRKKWISFSNHLSDPHFIEKGTETQMITNLKI